MPTDNTISFLTSDQAMPPAQPTASCAHKRKAAVPHRRDELVAQTAQSLIVPNGVLLDLESDAVANSASGTGDMFTESAPPPLDVGPSHSPPPPEVTHSSKSRSLDEGEIVSEESLHGRTERSGSLGKIVARPDDHEINTGRDHSPVPRSDSRRSSVDSGRGRRDERKMADRLKDFGRNPPKSDHRSRKSTTDRTELKDAVIFESGNVPKVHTPLTTGSRTSRERTRGFSSLFEEGHSNPSSRDSSPHREKLSRKEEERRRREKEMEKERQRDKERLKRQRRDRHRDGEHPSRHSPDRKLEKKTHHAGDEDKPRDAREKEKKREQVEERRVVDEAEKRKAEEKSRREMVKKKKEEELEARRQAELQRPRRDEEKAQRHEEGSHVGQEDTRKESEEARREANSEASDGQETARSAGHSDQASGSSDDDNASSVDVAQPVRNDEEMPCGRKESRSQDQKTRNLKNEPKKSSEISNRHPTERDGPPESEDDVAPVSESEERKKKSREETRPSKGSGESRKASALATSTADPCTASRGAEKDYGKAPRAWNDDE
ncbi:hypothetical protein TELCIR_04749 [Teladorsagia circumcincta]|uniref:Uncharacterized protein n=1 Tax=Teladorsagia circumcincta TaxID=45464 RepID=A0A2G9USN6_TELCI|nr:hypothetical protein TELCIR_04749 [Teladorsagia circumcincta]